MCPECKLGDGQILTVYLHVKMTEDLVKSTSSQRSNPRVLRRVRPVPYESCGGVCSFLNSGCFSLCCNGQSTRRRSSVYAPSPQKEVDEVKNDEDEAIEQVCEQNAFRIEQNIVLWKPPRK